MLKIEKDEETGGVMYDDCYYDTVKDALSIGVLEFCGCGIPDAALALVIKAMKTRAFPNEPELMTLDRSKVIELIKAEPEVAAYIIFYLLDRRGLTEHGSSVPGWLTPMGEEFIRFYDSE